MARATRSASFNLKDHPSFFDLSPPSKSPALKTNDGFLPLPLHLDLDQQETSTPLTTIPLNTYGPPELDCMWRESEVDELSPRSRCDSPVLESCPQCQVMVDLSQTSLVAHISSCFQLKNTKDFSSLSSSFSPSSSSSSSRSLSLSSSSSSTSSTAHYSLPPPPTSFSFPSVSSSPSLSLPTPSPSTSSREVEHGMNDFREFISSLDLRVRIGISQSFYRLSKAVDTTTSRPRPVIGRHEEQLDNYLLALVHGDGIDMNIEDMFSPIGSPLHAPRHAGGSVRSFMPLPSPRKLTKSARSLFSATRHLDPSSSLSLSSLSSSPTPLPPPSSILSLASSPSNKKIKRRGKKEKKERKEKRKENNKSSSLSLSASPSPSPSITSSSSQNKSTSKRKRKPTARALAAMLDTKKKVCV